MLTDFQNYFVGTLRKKCDKVHYSNQAMTDD